MKQSKKKAAAKPSKKSAAKKTKSKKVTKEAKVVPMPAKEKPVKSGKEVFIEKIKREGLRNDDVLVDVKLEKLSDLTGYKIKQGMSVAVVCNKEIVNIVSPQYGLVENKQFFMTVEEALMEADLTYITRSFNRGNRDFSVEYILDDENHFVNVKGKGKDGNVDRIIPMLRFTNTYGGGPCSGNFGFYREVCGNGLHIAETKMVGFKVRHIGKTIDIALPNIKELVKKFMDNEFFSLQKKFKVLAETQIKDLGEFVKITAESLRLFKYAASEKNPTDPSKKAKQVLDQIAAECTKLEISPNLWIGYNAFNTMIHASEKQTFNRQRKVDIDLFNTVLEIANNN